MSAELNYHELRLLFTSKSDGTLSEEQHARLEFILSQSKEARRLWFLHADIETGLSEWAEARGVQSTLLRMKPPSSGVRASSRQWVSRLAVAAALVLVSVLMWPEGQEVPEELMNRGVAVLASVYLDEWADEVQRTPGTVLGPADTLRLNSGAVLVEFYSGARVVMEGPAELQLVSVYEAFLCSGIISAMVPPQARGFTVESPGMKVMDLGTEFGFSVNDNEISEVHVFAGTVEVTAGILETHPLKSGEALRLEDGVLTPMSAERPMFLTEAEFSLRNNADARRRFAAWREASRALSADPDTMVHYVFDKGMSAQRTVPNEIPSGSPASQGNIVGGSWTEGRWPNKRALEFFGEGARVRLTVTRESKEVTLLAWLRIDALPHHHHSLLSAEMEVPGSLHWLLTRRGQLRLAVARDLGRPNADWEAVNSEEFVSPERFGQWLLLATTFDGTTVRHYGNGQLIGSGLSYTPPALLIGTADLGNWLGQIPRQLPAAMDEFAILSRVMSAEELLEFYENGKP